MHSMLWVNDKISRVLSLPKHTFDVPFKDSHWIPFTCFPYFTSYSVGFLRNRLALPLPRKPLHTDPGGPTFLWSFSITQLPHCHWGQRWDNEWLS